LNLNNQLFTVEKAEADSENERMYVFVDDCIGERCFNVGGKARGLIGKGVF
jgi:hypothetical protein